MGINSSKSSYEEKMKYALTLVNETDAISLCTLFTSLCHSSSSSSSSNIHGRAITMNAFINHISSYGFCNDVSKEFFISITKGDTSSYLYEHSYLLTAAYVLNGTNEQRASILYSLIPRSVVAAAAASDDDDDGGGGRVELVNVHSLFVRLSIIALSGGQCIDESNNDIVIEAQLMATSLHRIMYPQLYHGLDMVSSSMNCTIATISDIENLLNVSSVSRNLIDHAMRVVLCGYTKPPFHALSSRLLGYSAQWMLRIELSDMIDIESWRLVYSSFSDGESFSRFSVKIQQYQGPTLLVLRDSDGYIFGGFAAAPWTIGPRFFGFDRGFLFSILPSFGLYTPTGYNQNYQYLNSNMETMPNGLGMGGQLGYFGLFIDAFWGTGHSKAHPLCSTYNSPRLSCKEEFKIAAVEVWSVGEQEDQVNTSSAGSSVLDNVSAEDKLLFELSGRKSHSHGLREPGHDE